MLAWLRYRWCLSVAGAISNSSIGAGWRRERGLISMIVCSYSHVPSSGQMDCSRGQVFPQTSHFTPS
jgi:hypothetical protein